MPAATTAMSLPSLSALSHSYRCGAHTGTLFTAPPGSEGSDNELNWFNATGECSICIEPLFDESPATVIGLTCGHLFHKKCLSQALVSALLANERGKCPICRKSIEKVDLDDFQSQTDVPRNVIGPRSARPNYSFGHDDGLNETATALEYWLRSRFHTPEDDTPYARTRITSTSDMSNRIETQIRDWWQIEAEISAEQTTTEHVDAVKHLASRVVLLFLAPADGTWFRAHWGLWTPPERLEYRQQLLRLKGAAVKFLVTAKRHAPDTIAGFANDDAFPRLPTTLPFPASWAVRTPWAGFLEYMETLDVTSDEYRVGLELFRAASGREYGPSDRRVRLSWLW